MKQNRSFFFIVIGGFLITLALLGGLIIFYTAVIHPSYQELRASYEKLANLQATELSARRTLEEIEKKRPAINQITDAFLNQTDVIALVTLLEETARRSNVALTIDSADIATTPANKHSNFVLTVEGSLNEILRFMTLLEAIPYFAQITDTTITGKTNIIQADLTLHILIL